MQRKEPKFKKSSIVEIHRLSLCEIITKEIHILCFDVQKKLFKRHLCRRKTTFRECVY